MTNNYNEFKNCDAHGVQMQLRESNGKKFYSHGERVNGVWYWCHGNGYVNHDRFGPRFLFDLPEPKTYASVKDFESALP